MTRSAGSNKSPLEEVLEALRDDPRLVIDLRKVADLTGWSLRTLQEDCKDARVLHVYQHGNRGMRRAHIAALLEQHTVVIAADEDVIDQARAYNASRQPRSRSA